MKRWVVFGQRGVGKTTFLRRLRSYWIDPAVVFLDLDQEIELKAKKTVTQLFNEQGEAEFRKLERSAFAELIQKHSQFVISVGGGFPVSLLGPEIHALWLQRPSDKTGRIFLNRPRLEPQLSDLEEYFQRAQPRAQSFADRADERYLMPEGLEESNTLGIAVEREIFSDVIPFNDFSFFTISPQLDPKNSFLKRIQGSGWELRDDWLSESEILALLKNHQPRRILLSFRSPEQISQTQKILAQISAENLWSDWALELGPPPLNSHFRPQILSLHDFQTDETLENFLRRLEQASTPGTLLKAAPIIRDWKSLETLWRWQAQDPKLRSVVPRSPEGRWSWFRLLMKNRQKINFWKDSEGSALDQPSLFQWLATPPSPKAFAAILGSPVALSQTPLEQMNYFGTAGVPVFAIDLKESEWNEAFPLLSEMGLMAAAVTSPLKTVARKSPDLVELSDSVQRLGTLNTLYRTVNTHSSKFCFSATNTDREGFESLAQEAANVLGKSLSELSVIVWGGGGTLPVIREVFPQAQEYSLRTGKLRALTDSSNEALAQKESSSNEVDLLIWAAGPTDHSPPPEIRARMILDLNYREDSLARSYAKSQEARYLSGLLMFKVQALHQRKFWSLKAGQ